MRRLWPLLPLLLASGCLDEPPYRCQSDEVCFLQGFQGTCDLASARCVYPSADCRGINSVEGYVDGNGNCVPAPNSNVGPGPTTTGATTTDSGSTETTDAQTSTPPTTTDPTDDSTTTTDTPTQEGSSSGDDAESSTGSDPTNGEGCEGMTDITDAGTVTATTTFPGFPAEDSVDDDPTSSWFSTGPEGKGGPSVYGWNAGGDRCINRIEVDDNSVHEDPTFRTGFGFGNVVVRVVQNETVVFEETVQLPGTPDGPVVVDTGGIIGSRVLLELNAHENEECGGFSELRVFGGA